MSKEKETIPKSIEYKICTYAKAHSNNGDMELKLQAAVLCGYELAENEIRKYELAITSLTPGGSEYVNDPKACVDFVRNFQKGQHELIRDLKAKIRRLEQQIEDAGYDAIERDENHSE